VEWSARSLQAFADHPLEDLVENFDLLVIDHPHIPLVADDDLLARLEGCGHDEELALLAEQSLGSCHSSYSHGGHQYGLAIDAAAQVSLQRPDLVGDPPRTWSEVLDLAGEGKVLWPCKPVDAMSSFLTLSAQMGEEVCSREGLFVTNETGLAVLDLLHRLADRVGPECLAYNPIDVAEKLSTTDEHCYVPLAFG
jgi:multiple sugar transport system substrate-binding protein